MTYTEASQSSSRRSSTEDRERSRIVRSILEHKVEHVSTFAGRSQYSLNGKGASACGLAALNCARLVLAKEKEGAKGAELLRYMVRKDTVENILSICKKWSSRAHLDVDEILKAPLFENSFDLLWVDHQTPGKNEFQSLLQRLHMRVDHSAAIIITRPPEIICVLKIVVEDKAVFVTFDSHPRETHPAGAAFTFHPSLDEAATYLSSLLPYDPKLIGDNDVQWQAQLLASFSGHVLVAKSMSALITHGGSMEALIDSSLEILALKAEVADLRRQNVSLQADNRRLEDRAAALEVQVGDLLDSSRMSRYLSGAPNTISRSSVHSDVWRSSSYSASTSLASGSGYTPRRSQSSKDGAFAAHPLGPRSSRRLSSRDKGKLVLKERKDDDIPFATHLQWVDESQAMEHTTNISTGSNPWSRNDSPPIRTSQSNGKGKCKLVVQEKNSSGDDEAYGTYLQFQWRDEDPDEDLDEDSSLVFAAQQQAEFEEEDERLREQLKALQEATPSVFKCGICLEEESEYMIARIQPCGHAFCRDCIRGYLQSKLGEHRFPILCPSCTVDKKTSDPGILDSTLAQQIGLTEEQFALFTELEMASFSILLHCRKCKQAVFVDKCEYNEEKIIVCPLPGCTHAWCKNCNLSIEIGGPPHSCDGTSELSHLMNQRGWKHCPGCRTPAEKIDGCNHVACVSPGCNAHFCYACGNLIVQSVLQTEIRQAVSNHYSRCRLIEDIIAEAPRPRRPAMPFHVR